MGVDVIRSFDRPMKWKILGVVHLYVFRSRSRYFVQFGYGFLEQLTQ